MSGIWRSTRKFIYRRILHADDTPHRIALGVAIGTFVGFTPTMGLQSVITLAIATLFRANKVVGLPFVWITNPLTFVPFYWACWRFGTLLRGQVGADQEVAVMHKLTTMTDGGTGFISGCFDAGFWSGLLKLMFELGFELWLGCTVAGLVAAGTMFLVTKWVVTAYRTKREDRFVLRRERRRIRIAGAPIKHKRVLHAGKTA